MNPKSDDDLLAIFARARQCDHENAPAWRPAVVENRMPRPSSVLRWVPAALVTACVIMLAVFLMHTPQREPLLSEALPPLFESQPGELFARVEPSLLTFEAPSDFLLPDPISP